jgi:hypothetical protein
MFGQLGYQPVVWIPPALSTTGGEIGIPQFAKPTPVSPPLSPDQFTLFQLSDAPDSAVADLHSVQPALEGSEENPDARVRIDLVSFQIGSREKLDPGMQATLRLDMGEDATAVGDRDPLFWSIAAGLDLVADAVTGVDSGERTADFSQTFRRRPIEIAGGLGQFKVELVAHPPLPWWRRMFQFASSSGVKKLVAAVGFPGIALDAVKLLDEALSRFEEKNAKSIFASRPLTLALTGRAASEFSAGLSLVKPAILNTGLFLLIRQGDAGMVRTQQPYFLGGYGKLVPRDSFKDGNLTLSDKDPFADLSYAILRVKSRSISIQQSV